MTPTQSELWEEEREDDLLGNLQTPVLPLPEPELSEPQENEDVCSSSSSSPSPPGS
jgi:hypothetical protein